MGSTLYSLSRAFLRDFTGTIIVFLSFKTSPILVYHVNPVGGVNYFLMEALLLVPVN